ncbi:MAG: hypothetical protein K0S28_1498 [Paucimonas sp.]|jgi:uncharacterized membrane protein YjgN (DUF898 family)|nr:hypothetical protein [Paucimonas sp.]
MTTAAAVDSPFGAADETMEAPGTVERFSFTGTGSEYFRIWIVNLLLTIVTLGIYSAWAKVRNMRYFYDNTHLAGSSFEYHGNPIAILKGRIVAVALFAGYNLAFKVSVTAGFVMLGLLFVSFPWLIWKSLQFKLHNSSYRGIRFGFRGSLGQVYKTYLGMPLLSLITLYLALPFAHQRMKKFQHEESRFGTTHFSFDASVGSFYLIYLIGFAVMMAGFMVIGLGFAGTLGVLIAAGGFKAAAGAGMAASLLMFFFAIYAWLFLMMPLFLTLTQNLVWSSTAIDGHRFKCDMKWARVMFIAFTNVLGIVCTLGLYMPFAKIRFMKYRMESMSLEPSGSLDNFIAGEMEHTSATGEGMADIFDFDLSL